MKTRIKLFGAATAAALTLATATQPANAECYGGCGYDPGAAVALGLFGLGVGAAVGAAAAQRPVYYAAPPVTCHYETRAHWNGYAYVNHNVRVCY
jgi:hypothetical protein